jgi:hypothetical protein
METHSKLQLYGVLHLTFGFGNTIANLIYINIIINKGRERNCSPYNTDGYICEDFNSLWTVPLLQMAILCSVWVFIFLYNFLLITLRLLQLYFYIADVTDWSRELDIKLSDW